MTVADHANTGKKLPSAEDVRGILKPLTADDDANTGVDIIAVAKKFAPEVVYLRLVELEAADARITELEAALGEYENPDNWDTEDGPPFVWVKDSDPPRIARAALATEHTQDTT